MAIEIHVIKFEDDHFEVVTVHGSTLLSKAWAGDVIEADCIADMELARWNMFGVSGTLWSSYPLPVQYSYFFERLDVQVLARDPSNYIPGGFVSERGADHIVRKFADEHGLFVDDHEWDAQSRTHYYFMEDKTTVAVFPDGEIVQWGDRIA